jgi:hypothetical protein
VGKVDGPPHLEVPRNVALEIRQQFFQAAILLDVFFDLCAALRAKGLSRLAPQQIFQQSENVA